MIRWLIIIQTGLLTGVSLGAAFYFAEGFWLRAGYLALAIGWWYTGRFVHDMWVADESP